MEFDSEAEDVYWAMVTRPELDVEGLAAHLSLSPDAVRATQSRLAALTLLRSSREAPDRLRPVHPEHGLSILAERQETELERRRREHERGRAAFAALAAEFAEFRARSAAPQGERVTGLDAIQSTLETLTSKTAYEVASLVPGGPQPAEALNASRPLDESLARRGIELRSICQDAIRSDPAHLAYTLDMARLGMQTRTLPTLPLRLIIIDRALAVIPIVPSSPADGITVLRETGVVEALGFLFDELWHRATPVSTDVDPDGDTGLAPSELELLRLLGEGSTDEAAAKRLGVSLRTVRRMMAHLMTRLGAASRFEAGLQAGRRGWL